MDLTEKIESAFSHREKPTVLSTSTSLAPDETEELDRFADKLWSDITCIDVQNIGDAIYHFSGEAFCYFLPGFLLAGIRTDDPESLAFNYIIYSLDRSPVVEYWDAQFLSRWPLLTTDEISAVQEWLLWLVEALDDPDPTGNAFDRCFDTLELLRIQKESTGH